MIPVPNSFRFNYAGRDLVYGRGCINDLDEFISNYKLERALIVCGSNVGANKDAIEPVRQGLGDQLIEVFDETTSAKSAETVYKGIEVMQETVPDVLIGLGGGSSIDIARQMSVFAADDRSLSDLRAAARKGHLESPSPDRSLIPVVTVPTTFAGADISRGGSMEIFSPKESPTDNPIRIGGLVTPIAVFYDPNLFESTPIGALTGSAMNGFNKGIETIYAQDSTPITDATAIHGLKLLQDALSRIPDNDPDAMERSVIGIILVQFELQTSIVHSFGHGFSRQYPVQQGAIHAAVVPHILRYIFDQIDARRELIAEGLEINIDQLSNTEIADAIVNRVVAIRDSLDLPTRLREIDPVDKDDFPAIADSIRDDSNMERTPDGLNPTSAEIESVLREAW